MRFDDGIFGLYSRLYENRREVEYSLEDYLRACSIDPAFADDFFGMEDTIERIVGFFRHAAQGLEERKQVLYLLGPVGGGKSSLAERLKLLMEKEPIYVLKAGDEISPVFESPLGLFDPVTLGPELEQRYGIPPRRPDE